MPRGIPRLPRVSLAPPVPSRVRPSRSSCSCRGGLLCRHSSRPASLLVQRWPRGLRRAQNA
ncbi:MAG: hypothetical protein EOP18_02135 [Rhizobiaceae bacterium]|nr:MAG: hypothetical protein EOP18_02135 [Rhizobiaceae bacterium]